MAVNAATATVVVAANLIGLIGFAITAWLLRVAGIVALVFVAFSLAAFVIAAIDETRLAVHRHRVRRHRARRRGMLL